jgi:alpha-glucosidase
LRLRVPTAFGEVAKVRLRSVADREPFFVKAVLLATVTGWHWWEATLPVSNPHTGYRWMLTMSDGRIEWVNQAGVSTIETRDSEDFAIVVGNPPPTWLPGAVMYQIFPDRFARSAGADARPSPAWAIPAVWTDPVDPVSPARTQQLYGGDLDGIREHLDHLTELGVTVIYLTPVFPAESNHRYDATTFDEVDPLLGGDAAYIRLIEAAHARGMRVIGDLTANHTGTGHDWFRAAFGHPGAVEEAFYYFLDEASTEYESWLGFPSLPKLDWSSGELARRFVDGPDSVVARWLEPPFSLDGWRIDVANMTGRLGDEDHNEAVRRRIRRTMVDVDADTYLVAESTADATGDLQGDAWHGAMTYVPFTRPLWNWLGETSTEPYVNAEGETVVAPWYFGQPVDRIPRFTARQFVASLTGFTSGLPWSVRLGTMNTLDSHDTARFASHAPPSSIPLAVGLSMTLPGVPVVWAGDEFGELGVDGETSRTPIPWASVGDPEIAARTALYRSLIALRRDHPVLGSGGLRWVHVDDDVIAFVREDVDETVLVVASRDDVDVVIGRDLLVGGESATLRFGNASLELNGEGFVMLRAEGPVIAVWTLPGVVVPATDAGQAGVEAAGRRL